MGGGTFFKVGGQVHVKKLKKIFVVWIGIVTSQALEYDVMNYTVQKSKLHRYQIYRWTTWNSNRLLQEQLQINSVTRVHCTIYTDWMQSFEACITKICIHSGWHYCCSVMFVTARSNEWEVVMITSPMLSNVRHKAMITPVSPLPTRLIYIIPSYSTFYRSFEIILEMGTVHRLEFISNVLRKSIASKNIQSDIAVGSSGSNGGARVKREQTKARERLLRRDCFNSGHLHPRM